MLSVLERLYAGAIHARNRWYDARRAEALPVPVISVGNLTVGGTGKTPMVIDLVQRLLGMGRRPAVVARGYGSRHGRPNDEERLIRRRIPNIIYVADPNRRRGAQWAQSHYGADCVVLDDGFQHRRVGRLLDIVLIDASNAFGNGFLLPRGRLREPVQSLRRAHIVVLTRCDQASPDQLTELGAQVSEHSPRALVLRARHAVMSVQRLADFLQDCNSNVQTADGGIGSQRAFSPTERRCHSLAPDSSHQLIVSGSRVAAFAAIGNPKAFQATIRSLGAELVAFRAWPDHHEYTGDEIIDLLYPGRVPSYDHILTTEKDAVKLGSLDGFDPSQIGVVCVRMALEDNGDAQLQGALENSLALYLDRCGHDIPPTEVEKIGPGFQPVNDTATAGPHPQVNRLP